MSKHSTATVKALLYKIRACDIDAIPGIKEEVYEHRSEYVPWQWAQLLCALDNRAQGAR